MQKRKCRRSRKSKSKVPVIRANKPVVKAIRHKLLCRSVPAADPDLPPVLGEPIVARPYDSHDTFVLQGVDEPLCGAPKEVRKELDGLALHLQKHPEDNAAFAKIHVYVHKYLMGLVYRRYPHIRGMDENDVYQESLIAISRKAIPKFNPNKGMSFLNFAKLCINRHLITLLHASRFKRKDMPINTAISLDHNPGDDDDTGGTLSNVITDEKSCEPPYKEMDQREAFSMTLTALKSKLSEFEIVVLEEYLRDHSYKDIAKNMSKRLGRHYNEKACIVGGMKAITERGVLPIRKLKVGDKVLSFDGRNLLFKTVLNFWPQGRQKVVKVMVEEGRVLKCTADHLILTNEGWVEAGDLEPRHKTICANSDAKVVWGNVVKIEAAGEDIVYDIEVEDTHNFFASGLLSSNCDNSLLRCRKKASALLKELGKDNLPIL